MTRRPGATIGTTRRAEQKRGIPPRRDLRGQHIAEDLENWSRVEGLEGLRDELDHVEEILDEMDGRYSRFIEQVPDRLKGDYISLYSHMRQSVELPLREFRAGLDMFGDGDWELPEDWPPNKRVWQLMGLLFEDFGQCLGALSTFGHASMDAARAALSSERGVYALSSTFQTEVEERIASARAAAYDGRTPERTVSETERNLLGFADPEHDVVQDEPGRRLPEWIGIAGDRYRGIFRLQIVQAEQVRAACELAEVDATEVVDAVRGMKLALTEAVNGLKDFVVTIRDLFYELIERRVRDIRSIIQTVISVLTRGDWATLTMAAVSIVWAHQRFRAIGEQLEGQHDGLFEYALTWREGPRKTYEETRKPDFITKVESHLNALADGNGFRRDDDYGDDVPTFQAPLTRGAGYDGPHWRDWVREQIGLGAEAGRWNVLPWVQDLTAPRGGVVMADLQGTENLGFSRDRFDPRLQEEVEAAVDAYLRGLVERAGGQRDLDAYLSGEAGQRSSVIKADLGYFAHHHQAWLACRELVAEAGEERVRLTVPQSGKHYRVTADVRNSIYDLIMFLTVVTPEAERMCENAVKFIKHSVYICLP